MQKKFNYYADKCRHPYICNIGEARHLCELHVHIATRAGSIATKTQMFLGGGPCFRSFFKPGLCEKCLLWLGPQGARTIPSDGR